MKSLYCPWLIIRVMIRKEHKASEQITLWCLWLRTDMVLIIRWHTALKASQLLSLFVFFLRDGPLFFYCNYTDLHTVSDCLYGFGGLAQSLHFCLKQGSVKDDLLSRRSNLTVMLMTGRLSLLKSFSQVRFTLRLYFVPWAFFRSCFLVR